eukprot:NODE_2230_length_647_cov_94.816054_g1885_i0.p2 GENE.NODE_2230_length_647_cov_94.816054_g1885_i0~~NODE_2230_length_647_cov_94.816054_g1885_i0.p2  ORF type:complete len:104 (-),score=2.27 NODE_2230_length_647_cov_94.816054_g1885_i0:222-533(-)
MRRLLELLQRLLCLTTPAKNCTGYLLNPLTPQSRPRENRETPQESPCAEPSIATLQVSKFPKRGILLPARFTLPPVVRVCVCWMSSDQLDLHMTLEPHALHLK